MAYLESALENLQHELSARFAALGQARGGAPVYALEHGFEAERLRMVREVVGDAVRRDGIGATWRDRSLPLLVVATEVGYGYRGTGTEFWPGLCAALSTELSFADRVRLSELFEQAHTSLRLKRPADTPWNRLFHHIAWPISNAIAPLEIHRGLALALQRVFQAPPPSLEGPHLAEALGAAARTLGSPRLEDWAADQGLAGAVGRRLMELDHEGVIAPEAMERIWRDLSADTIARRAMRGAILEQRGRIRSPRTASGAPARATLQLLQAGSGTPQLAMTASFVDIPDGLRRSVRGVSLPPWRSAGAVVLESFLAGRSQVLALEELPEAEDEFLPGLDALFSDADIVDRLSKAGPDLALPLVFIGTGEVAGQVPARSISRTDEAWLVTDAPGDIPPSVQVAGSIGSALCLHVPEPPLASDWLARQGVQVIDLSRIQAVRAVVIGETPTGPIIGPGLPALFRLAGAEPAGVESGGGDRDVTLDHAKPYLLAVAESGAHQLSVRFPGRSTTLAWTSGGEGRDLGSPLEIILDPAAPSLEMLRRGEVAIHVRTSLPLAPLSLAVSVTAGEQVLATATAFGVQLPHLLPAGEGILDELVGALDKVDVPAGGDIWLKVEIENLLRDWWSLGREFRPVVWERYDQGWRPRRDEDEILQVVAVSAERPLDEPTEIVADADDLRLLLPVSNGAPVDDGGFVLGPRRLNFGASPALDGRAGRSWHGLVGLGARAVCLNYLRWSWAEARNPLLEVGRRRVAARLETAAVTQFCGQLWSDLEARHGQGAPDLWTALADVATSRGLAAGGDFPEVEGWQAAALSRHLAQRFARVAPNLWNGAEVVDAVAERLDGAILEAWEDLLEEIFRREGRFVLADLDVGNDAADWTGAVRQAREKVCLGDLLTYLLPRARSVALSAPDYQDLSLEDVADILVRSHVDLSPRGQPRWISEDDIRRGFLFWARPGTLSTDPEWQASLQRLLSDRQTARALRYAALRYRASRGRRI